MKIKLLALDLDDTLLDHESCITPRAEAAVKKAIQKDVKVIIATGRSLVSAKPYALTLGLDTPMVVNGGGEVYGNDDRLIASWHLDPEQTREIMRFAVEHDVYFQTYTDDVFCYEKENKYSRDYSEGAGMAGREVPGLRDMDITTPKVLLFDQPERIIALFSAAKEHFGSKYTIATSKPRFLEFNHPLASKGAAVEYVAKMYGFDRSNVMTIGDALNDISMIHYAGLGVAMGNAAETVRAGADFVTHSNREDGVARAIEQFILGS
jgi:Cof subfamily protein (haloacid dehalogenase superfamily)